VTQLRETYEAIWNDWFAKSGKTPAEAPGFERHNDSFDPRTGNGAAQRSGFQSAPESMER